ncbi:MAG: hypothetical protein K9J16_10835 [Melioribacteraceae bacterium]|nr:hypothetical protein [Melioribacteraceae bacterium]MCF8355503.1 hypothetical protein [Melioribacteraceae bacterium]MCF8394191.1 hypothetical protein [Melioribacteraceae bacterium]MCF8419911.1 hypothetical protein [Melioribacteraceae bacterium]
MKTKSVIGILILMLSAFGCYTVYEHPVVLENVENDHYLEYDVKFYNECAQCHDAQELTDFNYYANSDYALVNSNGEEINPDYAWWYDVLPPVDEEYTETEETVTGEDHETVIYTEIVRPILIPVPVGPKFVVGPYKPMRPVHPPTAPSKGTTVEREDSKTRDGSSSTNLRNTGSERSTKPRRR